MCRSLDVVEVTSYFDRNYGCVLCTLCVNQEKSEIECQLGLRFSDFLPHSALVHPGYPISVLRSTGVADPGWLPIQEHEYRALTPGSTAPIIFSNGDIKILMRRASGGHIRMCKAVDLFRLNPTWNVSLNPPQWAAPKSDWQKKWVACVLAARCLAQSQKHAESVTPSAQKAAAKQRPF